MDDINQRYKTELTRGLIVLIENPHYNSLNDLHLYLNKYIEEDPENHSIVIELLSSAKIKVILTKYYERIDGIDAIESFLSQFEA